jgi:hypothetical protein
MNLSALHERRLENIGKRTSSKLTGDGSMVFSFQRKSLGMSK